MSDDAAPVEGSLPRTSKPPWLMRRAITSEVWSEMQSILGGLALATVCEEAPAWTLANAFSSGRLPS